MVRGAPKEMRYRVRNLLVLAGLLVSSPSVNYAEEVKIKPKQETANEHEADVEKPSQCSQQSRMDSSEKKNKWRLELTPYLWLPSVDTEAQLGNFTDDVRVGFADVFGDLSAWGVNGRLEGWYGRLGAYVDGSYMHIEGDFDVRAGPLAAKTGFDFNFTLINFGAGARLFDWTLLESLPLRLTGDVLAGARYTRATEEASAEGLGSLGLSGTLRGTQDWFEPAVGGRVAMMLTRWVSLAVRGDAGGFDVGSASDLSWTLNGTIGIHFSSAFALLVGYQVYGLDYSLGSGKNIQGFDGILHGPTLGLTFAFGN